ncbi:tetratricopeptide repeat protein [Sulfurospirillum sp. hDNRA2]|uniref:tetratricopeptide repeat protein n=1 Tax=Sulfurospirillum sp. hDNRA2 TaxID=3237298 RepID=UPI0020B7D201|nr:tetratricopeptide repeat protein [Sulfurospirillum sp. DNRA8]MCP3652619.1 tetratricopeptide repeat protein [Sulfurospirillum sp. DNRA8]MCR1811470.1 tetratricopeptide repeat protein [Sulfurospirillum sp. DNRA8]
MLLRYSSFIFLICSLFASDTPNSVSAEKLIAAHEKALQEYARTDEAYAYNRLSNTIEALESFDLLHIQRPEKLSSKRFAHILNDYAFFLAKKIDQSRDRLSEISHPVKDAYPWNQSFFIKTGQYDDAIALYQKAIAEDPLRAIAYFNLADTLRKKLSTLNTYQEKVELTKEIKKAYLEYKKLSQKTTSWIEDFLRFNLVDTPPHDICDYIADYANKGRLKEVYGSGRSVEKENGDGFFQVEIAPAGSLGFEYAHFFDKATDKEIPVGDEIDNSQYASSNDTNPVPFYDQQYLLFAANGEFVDSVLPIGKRYPEAKKCVFKNEISYKFSPQSDPVLCPLLETDKHPPFIEFEQREVKIDFDNDGKKEHLYLRIMQHGALNYSYYKWDEENQDIAEQCISKKAQLLFNMQYLKNELEQDRSGYVECYIKIGTKFYPYHAPDNEVGWFEYNGIVYFESKFRNKEILQEREGQFYEVSYIKDGQIHKACEAVFDKKVKVIENPK